MGEVLYFPCTNKTIMTVAEAIEILKTLPPDFKLMIEDVSDSGWREEIEVTEIRIEPNWDSSAYNNWNNKMPMTSATHCVTFY